MSGRRANVAGKVIGIERGAVIRKKRLGVERTPEQEQAGLECQRHLAEAVPHLRSALAAYNIWRGPHQREDSLTVLLKMVVEKSVGSERNKGA